MLFLIEYDRSVGELFLFQKFDKANRRMAEDARLELELRLNRLGVAHEVVLLEAATESDLRQTHRRYFETLSELSRPKN
jgi:hypothetical protein